MLQQEHAHPRSLLRRVAFRQIREAEPVPVSAVHKPAHQGFVVRRVRFEVLQRVLIQVDVRPSVIAQRIPRRPPRFKCGNVSGMLLNRKPIDEAIHWRHMRVVKRGDDLRDYLDARLARWKWTMRGKVVPRERDLRPLRSRQRIAEQRQRNRIGHGGVSSS